MYEQLKLENQLCFRIYTAARLITGAYQPYFAPLSITYPQYLVLMVLWENDAKLVNDIAQRLMLKTNTVTPLLQRMEKQGLLTRNRCTEDTRQRIVCLTKKGKQMKEKAKNIPNCLSAEVLKYASIEELLTIVTTLDKLIAGFHKGKQD